MKRTFAKALPKTETVTGTTTANHLDVVVGVAAAGVAAAGIETGGTDVATLAIDLPRYDPILPSLLHVLSAPINGSLSLVFSQCLTPSVSSLLYTSN